MASEPRNYPDYVFVAYDEDFSAQTYDIAVSLEPGNLVGRPVKYIRHYLSTRPAPAATDTGLVTVGIQYAHEHSITGRTMWGWQKEWKGCSAIGTRELVTRSQAEELLAAERVKNETQAETIDKLHGIITKLEADNAAQAERNKELEKERDHWKEYSSGQGKLIESGVFVKNDEYVRLTALEAKLAAAEKALEPFADHANDRAVDDTGWRDKETVKIVVSIGDLRKARAVLGGKPS